MTRSIPPAAKPKTRRINYGRGHGYELDGSKVMGVTAVKDMLPKEALMKWVGRNVAGYAIDNWDELAGLKPSERLKLLEGAMWGNRDSQAAKGTEIHGFAEKLVAGVEVKVPDRIKGYVEQAARWMDDFDIEPILIEPALFSRRYNYAGTADLFGLVHAILREDGAGPLRVLADYKTGASGIWPDFAIQGIGYERADFYLDEDGQEQAVPEIDAIWGIHLMDDAYSVIPVIADRDWLFRRFRALQMILNFKEQDRSVILGAPVEPPER
jgi:hypothetical protein